MLSVLLPVLTLKLLVNSLHCKIRFASFQMLPKSIVTKTYQQVVGRWHIADDARDKHTGYTDLQDPPLLRNNCGTADYCE